MVMAVSMLLGCTLQVDGDSIVIGKAVMTVTGLVNSAARSKQLNFIVDVHLQPCGWSRVY